MNITQKGLAGEYYVLAQLTARGINASLTLLEVGVRIPQHPQGFARNCKPFFVCLTELKKDFQRKPILRNLYPFQYH